MFLLRVAMFEMLVARQQSGLRHPYCSAPGRTRAGRSGHAGTMTPPGARWCSTSRAIASSSSSGSTTAGAQVP